MFSHSRILSFLLLMLAMLVYLPAGAQEDDPVAITPLRLSYLEGEVGFWRNGAEDWTDARLNTPLAVGDALYVDGEGAFELQMGSRFFIRASDDSELSIVNQTSDFLQAKVTHGRVSFDLRSLPDGYSVEINTPNAVFTIDRPGYYRMEVDDEVHFVTRRGGQATMVPAGGEPMSIYPSEEIVVAGLDMADASTHAAPPLDDWDRWNYERSEDIMDAASERYLSPDIAGADDLDRYGDWRDVPNYGTVWVPGSLSPGWAPYTTGRWVWDPYYHWTWIDDAPWGWAPFHYGRWVHINGFWGWAPGPAVHRPVYHPALVAFYGSSSGAVSTGGSLSWVALSWGEPVIPWWGPRSFAGRPYWGGWGGPRIVNNVPVKNVHAVNVRNIQHMNTRVSNAWVGLPREQFGKGYVQTAPRPIVDTRRNLQILRGNLPVKPGPASVTVGLPGRVKAPEHIMARPVVATQLPQESRLPWRSNFQGGQFVTVPKPDANVPARPQYGFGVQTGDEPLRPSPLPRGNEVRRFPLEEQGREIREQRLPPLPQQPVGADERLGAHPMREPRVIREMQSPRAPLTPQEMREPRIAVPEAIPRTPREEVPERVIRTPQRERIPRPEGGFNMQQQRGRPALAPEPGERVYSTNPAARSPGINGPEEYRTESTRGFRNSHPGLPNDPGSRVYRTQPRGGQGQGQPNGMPAWGPGR